MSIGTEIKKRMIDAKMSQDELAAAIGKSREWVCRILNDHYAPFGTLSKIYEVLKMNKKKEG